MAQKHLIAFHVSSHYGFYIIPRTKQPLQRNQKKNQQIFDLFIDELTTHFPLTDSEYLVKTKGKRRKIFY
ncbi:hypothetical protein EPI10_032721 [Gossypium australe]|uniref:Uncharacterized protein n=1 Tax=Gossypium australe TaxID=47621 RepID=A0A5B6X5M2_9ROSI|nr:hypothetical protein EPI10_032721 [Gossypium australe]